MRLDSRPGVTLVELVVALALAALVLLTARALLGVLSDAGTRARRRVVGADERGVAMAVLRNALRTSVSRETGAQPFIGDAGTMTFSTRCLTGGGWDTPCRIEVTIVSRGDSSAVFVSERNRPDRPVLTAAGPLALRYVRVHSRGQHWLETWGEAIARPAAVAIVGTSDTLVLAVTAR